MKVIETWESDEPANYTDANEMKEMSAGKCSLTNIQLYSQVRRNAELCAAHDKLVHTRVEKSTESRVS
jgi:hypothetical protein